jgi:hypothetical protein
MTALTILIGTVAYLAIGVGLVRYAGHLDRKPPTTNIVAGSRAIVFLIAWPLLVILFGLSLLFCLADWARGPDPEEPTP